MCTKVSLGYGVRRRLRHSVMWAEGLLKMMTVLVTVFEAVGLIVSGKKTETMLLRTPNQAIRTSQLVVDAAGQGYMQTVLFLYLGRLVDASVHINQRRNEGSDSNGHDTIGSSGSCTL